MAFDRELISYDPLTCIATYHNYDHETGTSVFEYKGDSAPVIERNKQMANDPSIWKEGVKNEFVLYASIDPMAQLKLLCEHGIDVYKKEHGARLSKVLEDPDYRYLKCTTKKHLILAHD